MIENQKRRGHELLPQELRQRLPKLYSTDEQGDKAIAQVKFFGANRWCWYATEYDGGDTLFGLVVGDVTELGYFSLTELAEARIPQPSIIERLKFRNMISLGGYPAVVRDFHFQPQRLSKIRAYHASEGSQEVK
jgi:hypothetical protein